MTPYFHGVFTVNTMDIIISNLKFLNEIGLWEILSCLFVLFGAITAWWYFFFRKRYIHRLNVHTNKSRREGINYTSLINIEFRNFTGKSVVICNPYFKYKDLKRDRAGHRDSYSDRTEVKFLGMESKSLTEVDIFLRHKDRTETWVPVDPSHADEEIQLALDKKRVGVLYFDCIWIEERPQIDRVRYSI